MLHSLIHLIINWLFPQSPTARLVERLTALEFRSQVEPSAGQPHPLIKPLFDYRDPYVRAAIHLLKYAGRPTMAQKLGWLLTEDLMYLIEDHRLNRPIILPVPLSAERERKRGFNQSWRLCQAMKKHLVDGVGLTEVTFASGLLIKTKDTPAQTQLNRSARRKNLTRVFSVTRPAEIKGRDLIIIDDVSTTGATLVEIMKVLKQAGARQVVGLVIAH